MADTDSTPDQQQEPTQPAPDSNEVEVIQLNDTGTKPVKLQKEPPTPSRLTSRPIVQPDKGRGSALDPDVYKGIVEALIEGQTIIGISQRFGVSTATTEYIKCRPEIKEQVPSRQSVLINKTRHISNLAMARLEEALENGDVSADRLPVAVGIALTKEAEAAGNAPTTGAVHQHLHISHQSVSKILEALPVAPANNTAD
jgi:hypothetical protein